MNSVYGTINRKKIHRLSSQKNRASFYNETSSQKGDQAQPKATLQAVSGDLNKINQSQVPYDTEKFFETHNGDLICLKNIFDIKQFWERINAFFDIRVNEDDMKALKDFYCLDKFQLQMLKVDLSLWKDLKN